MPRKLLGIDQRLLGPAVNVVDIDTEHETLCARRRDWLDVLRAQGPIVCPSRGVVSTGTRHKGLTFSDNAMCLLWPQDIPACEKRSKNFRDANAAVLLLVCLEQRQDYSRDRDRGAIQCVCKVRPLLTRGFGSADIKAPCLVILSPHTRALSWRVYGSVWVFLAILRQFGSQTTAKQRDIETHRAV